MKQLKAIPLDEIPGRGIGPGAVSVHEPLYQDVLRLNGLVMPVEHGSADAAHRFTRVCQSKYGRARVLGISASRRGKIVYLFRGKNA